MGDPARPRPADMKARPISREARLRGGCSRGGAKELPDHAGFVCDGELGAKLDAAWTYASS